MATNSLSLLPEMWCLFPLFVESELACDCSDQWNVGEVVLCQFSALPREIWQIPPEPKPSNLYVMRATDPTFLLNNSVEIYDIPAVMPKLT